MSLCCRIIFFLLFASLMCSTASAQEQQKRDDKALTAQRGEPTENLRSIAATLREDGYTNIASSIEQRITDWKLPWEPLTNLGLADHIAFENQTDAAEGKQVFDVSLAKDLWLLAGLGKAKLWKVFDATTDPIRHHTGNPELVEGAYADAALVGKSGSIMLWGPYLSFDPGRYLVVYRLQLLEEVMGDNACFLDVSYKAVTYSGRRPGTNAVPARVWNQIPVPLGVPQNMQFEFRFWPHGNRVALDRIYVYRLTDRSEPGPVHPVSIMGAIARPGFYIVPGGSTSADNLFKLAGGTIPGAQPDKLLVWRQNESDSIASKEETEIVSGDIVWVPERKYTHLLKAR